MFIFQTRQFPRQLCQLDQWKCFVWSMKLWMFVKETWHVLVTRSAWLTKLTAFFRVLEALCHCDFRKMDVLKVNKINLAHSNSDGLSSCCEDLLFFLILMRMFRSWNVASYRRHLWLHNDQVTLRETWLSVWSHILVWGKCRIDILAEILILFNWYFSNKNNWPQCQHLHTSMLKDESHVLRDVPQSLCNSRWWQ